MEMRFIVLSGFTTLLLVTVSFLITMPYKTNKATKTKQRCLVVKRFTAFLHVCGYDVSQDGLVINSAPKGNVS